MDNNLKKLENIITLNSQSELVDFKCEGLDLISDMQYDSINLIKLIVEIESEFEIEIPDDMLEMSKITNCDYLISTIMELIKNKNKE